MPLPGVEQESHSLACLEREVAALLGRMRGGAAGDAGASLDLMDPLPPASC